MYCYPLRYSEPYKSTQPQLITFRQFNLIEETWSDLLEFLELSYLRNVKKKTEDQGSLPFSPQRPVQVPVYPSLAPSSHSSSIYLSSCQAVAGQHSRQTWATVRLVLPYEGLCQSCPRALLDPVGPRQLNLGSGQSEESGSCPISLHYGAVLFLCCRVAVLLQRRGCLIHHQ